MISPDRNGLLWIDDLTGGLNDTDAPQAIGQNQCQIAQNIEWTTTRFAQRRQGGTNGIHATEPWGAQASLHALMRHTPTADETAAELFAVDNSTTPIMGRMSAGNQFAAVTVSDAWTLARVRFINGVSLNGKFFIAGASSVDRLHVWTGSTFRKVGLTTPAAATVANTGAGSYAATPRYYKVQWVNDPGSSQPRVHSELSPAVSFTPSGAGTHARVTRPTAPSEGETAWFVWGSPDGVNYYLLAGVAIATTTYDDNTAPSNYSTVLPAFAGFPTDPDYFTKPISPKYLLADEDRLLLLSSWETASMASAVMWTPVIGTTPPEFFVDDSERVPSGNRLDLDRSDGGGITGGGIVDGIIYVFKLSHIYRLDRTGNVDLPYRGVPVTKSLGAISHKSIVVGEDEAGRSCLYFLSRRGPYRLGANGLEFLGRDIQTFWRTVNNNSTIPAFGVYHAEKRQVWWWVTLGAGSASPDRVLVYHVRHGRRTDEGDVRGGWTIYTEGVAAAFCAVMFANTLGATMSLDLKPYAGQIWVTSLPDGPCIKYDSDATYTDRGGNATTYIGRVKTAAFPPAGPGQKGGVTQLYVLATTANRALALDVIRDFNAETRNGTVTLPAAGANLLTRALVKVEDDARAADSMYVELVLDDDVTPASSAAWSVDALGALARVEGPI
jgi:hypothetical protein